MGRPHGLQRGWLLEPEGRGFRSKLVVGGVEVAAHHRRHDGAPAQVDHAVQGPVSTAASAVRTAVMRRPSTTTVVRVDAVRVEHLGLAQNEPGYGNSSRSAIDPPYREGPCPVGTAAASCPRATYPSDSGPTPARSCLPLPTSLPAPRSSPRFVAAGSAMAAGTHPMSLAFRLVPGGTISSMRSSMSRPSRSSSAGSCDSRCSIVLGPMIGEVTAGCSSTNPSASSIKLSPRRRPPR